MKTEKYYMGKFMGTPIENVEVVEDVELHYSIIGQGSPIFLLHGFGGSRQDWSENIQTLSKNHTLYLIDLPGFGASHSPPSDTANYIDFYCNMLEALRKKLNLDKVILIGNSMGGGIALQYALTFPKSIKSLVLANAGGLGKKVNIGYRILSIPVILSIGLIWIPQFFINIFWKLMFFNVRYFSLSKSIATHQWITKPNAKRFIGKLMPSIIGFNGQKESLEKVISNIIQPVCLFWGREDKILPFSQGKNASMTMPYVEFHPFSQCGHLPMIEKANEFNAIVDKFISQ